MLLLIWCSAVFVNVPEMKDSNNTDKDFVINYFQ